MMILSIRALGYEHHDYQSRWPFLNNSSPSTAIWYPECSNFQLNPILQQASDPIGPQAQPADQHEGYAET